jgi:hypothetical protein
MRDHIATAVRITIRQTAANAEVVTPVLERADNVRRALESARTSACRR